MRILPVILLNWLHQLGLALWLGGIVALGAVGAPAIFGAARARGESSWGQPFYTFAGEALGEAFRRFNYLALAAGLLALAAGLGYGALAGLCPIRLRVRAAVTAAALALAAWLTFGLYPDMIAARSGGEMARFDDLHRTYTLASHGQMVLLLGAAALTGWLHLDRAPHGAAAAGEKAVLA